MKCKTVELSQKLIKTKKNLKQHKYLSYFVGHASCDYLVPCSTEFLEQNTLNLNNSNNTKQKLIQKLKKEEIFKNAKKSCGGSMFNTAITIGKLLKTESAEVTQQKEVAFTGFITDTENGKASKKLLEESGIALKFNEEKYRSTEMLEIYCFKDETGEIAYVITQEQGIVTDFIDIKTLKESEYFVCSGYACQDELTIIKEDGKIECIKFINGIEAIFNTIKENGNKNIFSLSSREAIGKFRKKFQRFIDKKLFHTIFGNESEFMHLYKNKNEKDYEDLSDVEKEVRLIRINKILKNKSKKGETDTTFVMTRGEKNPIVYHNEIAEEIQITPLNKKYLVNVNGAGDAFAAGFLFGLSQDLDSKKCSALGHSLSLGVLMQEETILHEDIVKNIITNCKEKKYIPLTQYEIIEIREKVNNFQKKQVEKNVQPLPTCKQEASKIKPQEQNQKHNNNSGILVR